MNFDTLEKTWQKQTVTSSDVQTERVIAHLKRDGATAQRRIRGGIVLGVVILFLGWAMAIVAHITAIKPFTLVSVIAQMVISIFWVLFLARAFYSARAVQREREMMGGTLPEATEATLRTVELQIQNARIAGYAIPAAVAITAWMYYAKYLAAEMNGFGAIMAIVLTAAMGGLIGAAIWHRHHTHLAPRRAELKETLEALERNHSV